MEERENGRTEERKNGGMGEWGNKKETSSPTHLFTHSPTHPFPIHLPGGSMMGWQKSNVTGFVVLPVLLLTAVTNCGSSAPHQKLAEGISKESRVEASRQTVRAGSPDGWQMERVPERPGIQKKRIEL